MAAGIHTNKKDLAVVKVLHLIRTYGNHGGENQLLRLFMENSGKEAEEGLAMFYRDDCESGFRQVAGLEVYTLMPFGLSPRRCLFWELMILGLILPALWISFALCLRRSRPEIVITHNVQSLMVAWPFAMVLRKKKFAYIHRALKRKRKTDSILAWLYRPFRLVGGNSESVKESMKGMTKPSQLFALTNGIPIQPLPGWFGTKNNSPLVAIFVGRLIGIKCVSFILQTMAFALRKGVNITLHIHGEGPERSELEKVVSDLHIKDSITLHGKTDGIRNALLRADIFLFASEAEGMSNAVLEAMEAGLPSVVVDAPGVTECHISDETAFVVDRDLEAMACSIHKLADDPDLRSRMGQAARRRVKQEYSMAANRRRYLDLYQNLASGPTMEM